MKTLASIAAVTISLLATPVFAQESSWEDFRGFCKSIEGRWVGQVTYAADRPGFGKKGETTVSYFQSRYLADKHCLVGEFLGGDGSGTWILAHDPGANRITSLALRSNGQRSDGVIYKKDGKWMERFKSTNADGTKEEAISVLAISDGGETHTWTMNGNVGDKKLDETRDVWRRVHH